MIIKTFGIDPLLCPKCGTKMMYADIMIVSTADVKAELLEKHRSILQYFYPKKFTGNANPPSP